MLAALQLRADLEKHDTLTDVRALRRVSLKRAPVRERAETAENFPTSLPAVRRPIGAGEQLVPASLSRLRVREAVVKRQSSSAGKVLPFRVPDVRLSFVRSTDPGLKIAREGVDGFVITGDSARGGKISVAFEGLIFSVEVPSGTTPEDAMQLISKRISPAYGVTATGLASAIVVSHT